MSNTATARHAPSYILKAKDWLVSLVLVIASIVAATILGIVPVLTLTGDVVLLLSLVASGLGSLSVFVAYMFVANESKSYIDIPDVSTKAVGTGLVVGAVLTAIQAALTVLFVSNDIGDPTGPVGRMLQANGVAYLVGAVAANVFLVAPAEELLYRNGVQKILSRSHSTAFAVLGAAFIFTLPHVLSFIVAEPIKILTSSIGIFVNGIGYGVAYAHWKRVDVTIVAHAVYNCSVFIFAYFHVFG